MAHRALRTALLVLLAALSCPGSASAQDPDVGEMVRTMRSFRREGAARDALRAMRDGPPALRANPRVLGQRLLALQDLRKLEEARQLLTSLQLTEASTVLQIEVARLRALLDAGDEAAPAAIIQLAALHEGNVDVAALQVRSLIYREDFRAARRALDTVVGDSVEWTANELEAELLAARARSLMSDDSLLDDALPLLEQALERAPRRGDVRALYADALVRWQRFDQAEEQLALGLADPGPDRDVLLMAQGDLFRSTDRLDEAVASYEAVLEESPQDRAAQVGLARCLGRKGEKEEAVALLEGCLERSPEDLDALLVLAEFREAQDRLSDAEVLLQRVLEVRPNHLKACWRLSRVLARQGRMDEVDELVERYESRRERIRERAVAEASPDR